MPKQAVLDAEIAAGGHRYCSALLQHAFFTHQMGVLANKDGRKELAI